MCKIHELKPRLFDAGEVNITIEAFQRLKEGGVEAQGGKALGVND
ncbi:MAG TPA: hypothetical protein VFA77_16635 [Candidatus Eisenbacteria bacterium]|nr:hypothetical protein [Candidatus Eisenbacteria bacterium]